MKLPKLYAIIDRETLDARGMGVRAFAQELLEGGVRLVQYRDKRHGPQEVLRACAEIAEVFAPVEAMLVLNDRADLASLAGWGCHVGQGDLPVDDVAALLSRSRFAAGMTERKAQAIAGISTHNEDQVRVAAETAADYIAIGPVFATATKANAEPVVGLEGVRAARALMRKPLVAIGGITHQNARSVVDAGADSVALIGALLPRDEESTRQRVERMIAVLGD